MPMEKLHEDEVVNPTLTRIFGTSIVFHGLDCSKVSVKGIIFTNKIKEHFHRGHIAMSKAEWEKAVLSFSKAITLNPQLVEAYVLRAESYIQLCDFASACQNLRKAIMLSPNQTQFIDRLCFILYLQGQCLFEEHSYMKALELFTQASELQPHKSSYRFRSMACLLALKHHQECLQMISKELKQNSNPDIYILRARLYNYFLKPNQCYQDLHQALTIKPEHPEANTLLNKLLIQAKRAREEAVNMALKGNLQDSLVRINCAIENSPMDPCYYLFRGTLFRRLKDFDAAIEDFIKSLELSPQDCLFKLGELAFAEADYLEALTLCPGDQGARYRMGMLQEKLGLHKHHQRQYHKAEKYFSSAIEYNPEKANFYLLRAKSRLMLQDIFGARQDVATLLLLNPKHPQLVPMMANLFPGQSTESVLNSKTMVMAKTILERAMQSYLFQEPLDDLGLQNKGASPEKDVNKSQDSKPTTEQAPYSGETRICNNIPLIPTAEIQASKGRWKVLFLGTQHLADFRPREGLKPLFLSS
ncbi:tetratricopeptide repeat protein 16 isoform X4 [Macrotis lagotis]|uniref:tetratricopeptide repeat protein 16 isoform X4 n=1 Tax=Macrotis lagotis TaxID=92651 RepID=UPI003D6989E6